MTELTEMIAGERRDLGKLLGELLVERWDEPTLCAGWRVREVVAHVTGPFRAQQAWFDEDVESPAEINRLADEHARRDAAALSAAELAAALVDNADHPWQPPGGGLADALCHDVIHGLDITVGLGLGRVVPVERLLVVLVELTPERAAFFGTDLTGIRLTATDLDWTVGDGEPVTGAAQDLLLYLCGRKLPPGHLQEPARR